MSKREVEPVAGFVRSSRCAELPSLLGVATNERFLAEGSDPPRINPAYLFIPALTVGFKLEILSEISVYFSFWEANDFGRESDEGNRGCRIMLSIVHLLTFKRRAASDLVS